ncbi:unnamed protein product, partial [Meganyctiphanes norvegica]
MMASPPKPWERNIGVNQRQSSFLPDQTNNFQSSLLSNNYGGGGGGQLQPVAPPPLPPAPSGSSYPMNRPNYSSYGSYGGYGGTGGYGGGYGGYGGYGTFGGYNRFGMGMPPHPIDNGFIQLAEESSRPAFQSIESIVHAFGSVSMMLESTYHAVHSSFRAVLGVAEHFTRMKSQFAQIFSAFAVVRTLRWLYRKLLYLIGFWIYEGPNEQILKICTKPLFAPDFFGGRSHVIFTNTRTSPVYWVSNVVFGGPYLIWRLLSSITPVAVAKSKAWLTGQGEHYAATAAYDFQGRSKNELSFRRGQPLILAPKDQQPNVRGWLLASDGKRSGLLPANYIKIHGLRKPKPNDDATGTQVNVHQPVVSPNTGGRAAVIPGSGIRPEGHLVAPGIPGIPRGGHLPSGGQATQQLSSQQSTTQPITSQPKSKSPINNSDELSETSIQQNTMHYVEQQYNTSQITTLSTGSNDLPIANIDNEVESQVVVNSTSQSVQPSTSVGSVLNMKEPLFDISPSSSSSDGCDMSEVNSSSWDFGSSSDGNDNTPPSSIEENTPHTAISLSGKDKIETNSIVMNRSLSDVDVTGSHDGQSK